MNCRGSIRRRSRRRSSGFRLAETEREQAGAENWTPLFQMPDGKSLNPLFECELALELKMPVGELYDRMSLHELWVVWPLFMAYRRREERRRQNEERERQSRVIR